MRKTHLAAAFNGKTKEVEKNSASNWKNPPETVSRTKTLSRRGRNWGGKIPHNGGIKRYIKTMTDKGGERGEKERFCGR